jgi:hypothetical protein
MAITSTGKSGMSGTDSHDQDMAEKVHFLDLSATDGLTALAGGAQAGTSLSGYAINRFTTVASSADSVQLPAAKAGRIRIVKNAAASNAMAVFPQTGEFINALSVNASFSLAANKAALFFCAVDGTWDGILTA